MTTSLSDILLKTAAMALACAVGVLLLRNGMAIGLRVPLDPNEGWNAYHALAAMTGAPLYPPTSSPYDLMVNNYPPLSFYIVGLLGRITGDTIVAGRLVSLLSALAIAMGLVALLRQIGIRVLDGMFAGLFFMAILLVTSDYVAMDDPQLLGHALQIEALLLLLRERPAIPFAALLLAAGIFVKHNLIALPLSACLWLALRDLRSAAQLAGWGLGFGAAGLIACRIFLGINLLQELNSARVWRLANLTTAMTQYLSWAGLPLLVTAWAGWRLRRDVWMHFCLIYGGLALALGVAFSAGDGVDANIFFDLDIALALGAGLALTGAPASWRGAAALAYAAPLALFLDRNFTDSNFAYTEAFQKQALPDIAFLEINRGPALCENLSLCYWADKDGAVDVFNLSEQIQTGKSSDAALVHLLETGFFRSAQFDSWSSFPLGANVRAALLAHYRIDHVDDNGVFLAAKNKS
jgi:hypothetical protein